MRSPYDVAKELNAMKPGQCRDFSRAELDDIVGSDHVLAGGGRTGWQIVLDNVIGSSTPDWSFSYRGDGTISACRIN